MSIRNAVNIAAGYVGDGTSTTFNIDLASDPYSLQVDGQTPLAINLTETLLTFPSGVVSTTSGVTATLLLNVVMLTFATAPPAGQEGTWFGYLEY